LSVIRKLHLADDPEFTGGAGGSIFSAAIGLVRRAVSLLRGGEPPSSFEKERQAVETFEKNLAVKRLGLTYVISVSFRALEPDRAAEITNSVVDSYIDDQLEAKYQTTRRAGLWLQDRIKDLRQKASDAEQAVVSVNEKNHIVDTRGP